MERINLNPGRFFCPQPIYVLGTRNEDGQANFSIVTWIGFSWNGSPHIMMGLGGMSRTMENISRTKQFSANLVSAENIWLADYFGNTNGQDGPKVEYGYSWGNKLDVPALDDSKLIFECNVSETVQLDDSQIIVGKIENVQLDGKLADMDLTMIDLRKLNPGIYAPNNYFSIGQKIGECREWKEHLPTVRPKSRE